MLARSLLALLVIPLAVHAAELPGTIPASKCRGHKKIFAALDDGTATARKIKISSAFYLQAGSVAIHGCKNDCRESVDIGVLVTPGVTGDFPCLFLSYGVASRDGGAGEYWSNTSPASCTVTIVKNDAKRGRLKGTYHAELTGGSGSELGAGEIVGCFSAKRQNL